MSELIKVEEGIEILTRKIAENKKEVAAQKAENTHLAFSVKLLKLKRKELLRGK